MNTLLQNPTIYHINGPQKFYNFPNPRNSITIGRGKKSIELLELFCGFDIETTNIETTDGRHLAFAYHFQFSLYTPRVANIYLFRTWDNFLTFIDALITHYKLGADKHIVVAVANLSFEFQFLRARLQWDQGEFDFFAKENRQPLKATYSGIEFREVLSLTGGSLADLARDYCQTQKLVTYTEDGEKISDLDYTIIRNSSTPLSSQEEAYCINDVAILSEFMWWLFNNHIRDNKKVPMTFTGLLHEEFKEELKELCFQRDDKYHFKHGESFYNWIEILNMMQPDAETYAIWFKYLFRGGYVHANALYTGRNDLIAHMRDVTSHYPTRMNLSYCPMGPFRRFDRHEFNQQKLNSKCLILHVVFDFIRPTTTHSIESRNKIISAVGAHYDNGRLVSADMIEVYLTEFDFKIYQMYYTWAGYTILECWEAPRGKYPKYVLNVLNRHYKIKTKLKRSGMDNTTEYVIAKSRVNTCYGDLVKRMRLIRWIYDNEEGWKQAEDIRDFDKEIKKQILCPQWGIWVTAAARYELLEITYKLTKAGVSVYYDDTDSWKYKACHKAENIFKRYNAKLYRRRKSRGLRSEYLNDLGDADKEGKNKKTGEWPTVRFKALGAKRYIYSDGTHIKATVAGMPKASINQIGRTIDDIFENFNLCGYNLTPEQSGKLTAAYTDEPYTYTVAGEVMTELSGVALYKIPFSMNIKEEYINHVDNIQYQHQREDTLL